MKNALRKNDSKFRLIGKINGLAGEVKRARKRLLNGTKKEEVVWKLAYRKKVVGIDVRHHLLAYAFLRGTPYQKLEKKCAENNLPNADLIFQIIQAHAPSWIPYDPFTKTHATTYSVTLSDVQNWLNAREL